MKHKNGEPLTADILSNIYYDLNKKYFEAEVNVDEEISMEWARIPHFYTSFYVYKYATGFSSAIAISDMILKEGQPAVDRYIKFLKSGSSDYPLELLKIAGVDLSTPKPVQDALDVFEKILGNLKRLYSSIYPISTRSMYSIYLYNIKTYRGFRSSFELAIYLSGYRIC